MNNTIDPIILDLGQLSGFYDSWSGDSAITTFSGRQMANNISLATCGLRQLMNDNQLVHNRIHDVLSQMTEKMIRLQLTSTVDS